MEFMKDEETGVWIHKMEVFYRRLAEPDHAKKWLELMMNEGSVKIDTPDGKTFEDLEPDDYVEIAQKTYDSMLAQDAWHSGEIQ